MRDDPPWLILGSDVNLGRNLGAVQTNRLFHRQSPTPEFNPDFFASTVSDADCFFNDKRHLKNIVFLFCSGWQAFLKPFSPFLSLPYSRHLRSRSQETRREQFVCVCIVWPPAISVLYIDILIWDFPLSGCVLTFSYALKLRDLSTTVEQF